MGNYIGPKVRLSRSLGVPVAETDKHVAPRRDKRPGMHRFRRGRQSLYAIQLQEKQKIARFYNIRNSQLRHYVRKAHKLGGATTQVLQVMLECRFDNIIRRLRWARTIWQARQMVSHGHFLINGKKVDLPSLSLKAGEIDKITEFYTR